MNSIDNSGSSLLVQAAVSMEKREQSIEKKTGDMMLQLVDAAAGPQALPLADAGQPGSLVNVIA